MTTFKINTSCVLVVDMQTGLLPAIADHSALLQTTQRFLQAANLLEVPVIATEHWVEKIGAIHPDLQPMLDNLYQKTHFDASLEPDFEDFLPHRRNKILVVGTEAHVCVLQTGLGLHRLGYTPVLVTDCIGSRSGIDKAAACTRWAHYGLEQVTSEMVMFEWLEHPSHPKFKEVISLIK